MPNAKKKPKVVRLVDRRKCSGTAIKELRQAIREIQNGTAVSVGFVMVRRNGSSRSYTESECAFRLLGALETLKVDIYEASFKHNPVN